MVVTCLRFSVSIDVYKPRGNYGDCGVPHHHPPRTGSAFIENGSAMTESGSAKNVYLFMHASSIESFVFLVMNRFDPRY